MQRRSGRTILVGLILLLGLSASGDRALHALADAHPAEAHPEGPGLSAPHDADSCALCRALELPATPPVAAEASPKARAGSPAAALHLTFRGLPREGDAPTRAPPARP